MAKKRQKQIPATVAVYSDMLAMQCVLHQLVNEVEKLHGAQFRPRLKQQATTMIEKFPNNAFAAGYEDEARAMALDLVERLAGNMGSSFAVQ